MPQSFIEVVELFERKREAVTASHLKANIHLVTFEPGRIELRPTGDAPSNLVNQLSQQLMEWTGARWLIARSEAPGAPTLAQQETERESLLRNEVADHPLVRAVLEAFPGAMIAAVRDRINAADPGADAAEGDDFSDGGNTGEEA
jgi:DNA polymerase III subunit gamma/tau